MAEDSRSSLAQAKRNYHSGYPDNILRGGSGEQMLYLPDMAGSFAEQDPAEGFSGFRMVRDTNYGGSTTLFSTLSADL